MTSSSDADSPYIITVGNEKGGTGKSTTAVHLAVALMKLGYRVGCTDLDGRQATLSRYLANRRAFAETAGTDLPMPELRRIGQAQADTRASAEAQDREALRTALAELRGNDFIIIDTPGSDSYLSRIGHQAADSLITPLNDSFVDIDVLAHIDHEKRQVLAPSTYCKMVWEQNNQRVVEGKQPIDWVVMRNRLAHVDARNGREIAGLLLQLAKRIGFRLAPGFGERVVFRELFLTGTTMFDQQDGPTGHANPSHLNARHEIENLLMEIGILQPPAQQTSHAAS